MRKLIALLTGCLLVIMLGVIVSARADSETDDFYGSYIGGAGTYSSPAQYWINVKGSTFPVVETISNSCDYHTSQLGSGYTAIVKICFKNRHTSTYDVSLGLAQTIDEEQMSWTYTDFGAPNSSLYSLTIDWSAHDTGGYKAFEYSCGSGNCPAFYTSSWVNGGSGAEYDTDGGGFQCHYRAWGRYGSALWLVHMNGSNYFAANAAPFVGTTTTGCYGG